MSNTKENGYCVAHHPQDLCSALFVNVLPLRVPPIWLTKDGFSDCRNNIIIDNHELSATHIYSMLTYLTC